ncbi:unnamed protein product [Linum trigynum]|uniref:Uncharacterized protein n=1 Tax=Linum trigynum TaxID=586398 RepID=A0AAV2D0I7_9ROSI
MGKTESKVGEGIWSRVLVAVLGGERTVESSRRCSNESVRASMEAFVEAARAAMALFRSRCYESICCLIAAI